MVKTSHRWVYIITLLLLLLLLLFFLEQRKVYCRALHHHFERVFRVGTPQINKDM